MPDEPAESLRWLIRGGFDRALRRLCDHVAEFAPGPPVRLEPSPAPAPRRNFLDRLTAAIDAFGWALRGVGPRRLRADFGALSDRVSRLSAALRRHAIKSSPELRDLSDHDGKVRSQNGEDGIIEDLFGRVGATSRFFVEFGAEFHECNCAHVARDRGWSGLFIEPDAERFAALRAGYADRPDVRLLCARVTPADVEPLFAAQGVPREFDLLSIDIDGNDYWVWKALKNWSPRVVVIEYNASHPPPLRRVAPEDSRRVWDGTNWFGASLASLAALGRKKGYCLVATDHRGVNAFFLRNDLFDPDLFADPAVLQHYSPPAYGPNRGGHPEGKGEWLEI